MRTLEGYLQLPYELSLVHDVDDEGSDGWVTEVARPCERATRARDRRAGASP